MSIGEAVVTYIDSMPPMSRVNFPELVLVVMKRLKLDGKHQERLVDCVVHDIVSKREDLRVERGRGIVKWSSDE